MSVADWDPAAYEGRSALPQAEKEAEHREAEHREAKHREAEQIDTDPGESSHPVEKPAVEPKRAKVSNGHPLHRLAAVRRQQGVSLRNMARRLGADIPSVLHQEQEASDLPLSVLYQWQRALEVPVADLLVDSDAPLSPPVMERARLVKVMKTAVALMEKAHTNAQRRLVTMLVEQLLEIMPELREVSAWHSVGQRRTLDEFGRAIERTLPDDLLRRVR